MKQQLTENEEKIFFGRNTKVSVVTLSISDLDY